MLRVFIDTLSKVSSEDIENVNVQYLSIMDKIKNPNDFKHFKEYINKCLELNDRIVILSKVALPIFENKENIKCFTTPLNDKGMNLVLKQILYYREEDFQEVENRIDRFLELFGVIYYTALRV